MKVAFHFLADAPKYHGNYGLPILEEFFGILLSTKKDLVHLKISGGDLLAYDRAHTPEARGSLAIQLLCLDHPIWRDIDPNRFVNTIFSASVFVLAVDGLSAELREQLNASLKHDDTYLGAIQIYEANGAQWALYNQDLIPMYRYLEGHLRLFYTMEDEESKDISLEDHWRRLPFLSVTWESLGFRHTLFDAFDTYDDARRAAELGELLSSSLAQLADSILLRLSDLNPKLRNTLLAAFRVFQTIDTEEDCAQVAISCRRFLSGLADSLYPAREAEHGKRKLGQAEYRNRLWQYVEEQLSSDTSRNVVLTQLADVGNRIDKLDKLANKGLHGDIRTPEVHRLLMALVTLTYDLLSLTKPPQKLPLDPESMDIFMDLFRDSSNSDGNGK